MMPANDREQASRVVTSKDGTPIAYWRSGKGRPLVLVHGTTADHSRWDPLRPLLEPHMDVCAMDRRGRGASGDAEPYDVEREFEDVAAVVDACAQTYGGPVDLFGHSYGALCALEAARLTSNVRRLVLYEPVVLPGASPQGFADNADALLAAGRHDEVIELFFREFLQLPTGEIEKLRAQPAWQVRVAAAHTLPREDRAEADYRFEPQRFGKLLTPTLMLLGDETPAFLRDSTETVAAALPHARIVMLEGQQHLAVATAPHLVAGAIVPFLMASNVRPPT